MSEIRKMPIGEDGATFIRYRCVDCGIELDPCDAIFHEGKCRCLDCDEADKKAGAK